MNESDNFALVPRPTGVLEKAEPSAQRILSGMAVDTLALVKKGRHANRTLTILVGGDVSTIENFQSVIRVILKDECDLRFIQFGNESELMRAVEEQPFDLILVYLWGVFWSKWRDGFVDRAVEVLARIKTQYQKPILAQQGMDLTEQFRDTGVIFRPVLDIQTIRDALGLPQWPSAPPTEKPGDLASVKRKFRVLTCSGEASIVATWTVIIRGHLGEAYDMTITDENSGSEILKFVQQHSVDLVIAMVNNILLPAAGGNDRIVKAVDLLARLKAEYGIPIIAFSAFKPKSFDLPELLKQAGVDAFLWAPFDIRDAVKALDGCLKSLGLKIAT